MTTLALDELTESGPEVPDCGSAGPMATSKKNPVRNHEGLFYLNGEPSDQPDIQREAGVLLG